MSHDQVYVESGELARYRNLILQREFPGLSDSCHKRQTSKLPFIYCMMSDVVELIYPATVDQQPCEDTDDKLKSWVITQQWSRQTKYRMQKKLRVLHIHAEITDLLLYDHIIAARSDFIQQIKEHMHG